MKLLITKYFDENALPFIEAGSIKFGTLRGYRKLEAVDNAAARFSDRDEGKTHHDVLSGKDFAEMIKANKYNSIVNAEGERIEIPDTHLALTSSGSLLISEYVFCASEGGYSRNHHAQMRFGNALSGEASYSGDPTLKHYAVFDLDKLVIAVYNRICELKTITSKFYDINIVKKIEYRDKKWTQQPKASNPPGLSWLTEEQFDEGIFVKPHKFALEREVRYVLRPNFPYGISNEDGPLFIESQGIKNSIVEIGKFKRSNSTWGSKRFKG